MIDPLSAFRGRDYAVNDKWVVRQPTLGEIEEFGEKEYFGLIRSFTATPADRKVDIWKSRHVYWDTVDEYELFVSTFGIFVHENMAIVFPGVDFKTFQVFMNPKTKELALQNSEGVRIDRAVYTLLTDCLRMIHKIKKNREIGYDNFTKDCMIEDEEDEYTRSKNRQFQSVVLPFASYLSLQIGWENVWSIPIGAFFSMMFRLQKIKQSDNLFRGIYSGCVDIKKINKKELDYLSDV